MSLPEHATTTDHSREIASELSGLSEKLAELTEGIGIDGSDHDGASSDIEALMSAAIRLYATTAAREGNDIPPLPEQMASTTEAVMTISALMQAQNLNTFDLALWQSKLRRN